MTNYIFDSVIFTIRSVAKTDLNDIRTLYNKKNITLHNLYYAKFGNCTSNQERSNTAAVP